jgi:hypothetical protein
MAKKRTRKPPTPDHNITAPSVRDMAKKRQAAKRNRQPAEDVDQIAARIRRIIESK